ncbi:hypothetical protein TraAM80_05094, partial [Trypanosoma rangeli]
DDFESSTSSLKEQHQAAPLSAVQAGTPEEVKHDTPKKDEYAADDDFESSTSSLKEQHQAAPLSAVEAGTPEEVKHDTPKKDEYPVDDDFESSTSSLKEQHQAAPLSAVEVAGDKPSRSSILISSKSSSIGDLSPAKSDQQDSYNELGGASEGTPNANVAAGLHEFGSRRSSKKMGRLSVSVSNGRITEPSNNNVQKVAAGFDEL